MIRRRLVVVLLLGLLLTAGSTLQEKRYSADRFDVDAVVLEGGTLQVTETVTFRFVGGPFTFVYRELPARYTDGVTVMAASVDGRGYTAGTNAGQVTVEPGGLNPTRVTWHLEPTSNAVRAFTLTYQIAGIVRQEEGADFLHWWPLPDEREYAIAASTIRLQYPTGTELLASSSIAGGVGNHDPGARVVNVTAHDLGPNEDVALALRFPAGSLISTPPAWQAATIKRQDASVLWVGASAAIGALGLASALAFGLAGRQSVRVQPGRRLEEPDGVPAWQAGVLQGNSANVNWNHALAILFGLANRGVLVVSEEARRHWYQSRDFVIEKVAEPADLTRAEAALLGLLFESGKAAEAEVTFSELSRRISSGRWKAFDRTLEAELVAAGLIDPDRLNTRSLLSNATIGLTIVGGIAAVAMGILLSSAYGAWPLLVGGALLGVAVAWLIVAATYSVLAPKGLALAGTSRAFAHELRQIGRGKARATRPDAFDYYLPFAAAFGLVHSWAKSFEKRGWTAIPPWFHALSTADGQAAMGAFVAMTAASSSSAGSAAGAAGGAAAAGAAGGGASGAG